MELIQVGPGGLSVVSHVAVELSSVTDHATIHRLQTTEHHAGDLLEKYKHALIKCVQKVNKYFKRFSLLSIEKSYQRINSFKHQN